MFRDETLVINTGSTLVSLTRTALLQEPKQVKEENCLSHEWLMTSIRLESDHTILSHTGNGELYTQTIIGSIPAALCALSEGGARAHFPNSDWQSSLNVLQKTFIWNYQLPKKLPNARQNNRILKVLSDLQPWVT